MYSQQRQQEPEICSFHCTESHQPWYRIFDPPPCRSYTALANWGFRRQQKKPESCSTWQWMHSLPQTIRRECNSVQCRKARGRQLWVACCPRKIRRMTEVELLKVSAAVSSLVARSNVQSSGGLAGWTYVWLDSSHTEFNFFRTLAHNHVTLRFVIIQAHEQSVTVNSLKRRRLLKFFF